MNNTKQLTLDWILKNNRTPYPYSLQNAALKGVKPKQPCFFVGKDYLKPVDWKDYQDWGSLDKNFRLELIKAWHGDNRIEGIGCNAGWNGEFHFSMVDFDLKNFLETGITEETATDKHWEKARQKIQQAVDGWENRNPEISSCPRTKTQSGGYRYYVGFESVDKDWGNTVNFTFTQGGEKSLGELMTGPGGLGIILGKGLKEEYLWDRNPCGEVLVFPNPESVGLYQVQKAIAPSVVTSIYDNPDTPEQAREALSSIPVNQFDGDYQGWINVGMACHSAGLDFEDWDNWSQGSKSYSNSKDTFNHWKSFKDGGGITAATLFKFAKDNGYKPPRQQQQNTSTTYNKPNYQTSGNAALKPEQQAETQSNVVQFPRQQPQLNIEEIKDEFKKISELNLSKSEQQLMLNELARRVNIQPREIQESFKNYVAEIEDTDSLDDIKSELDDFLNNKNQGLDTSKYLPKNLNKITELATRLCLRPELALTIFYTAISSLVRVGTRIDLSDFTNFDQPTGLYSAIVAEPSQRKSPLINAIATKPLRELLKKSKDIYAEEMKHYGMDCKEFESDKFGNTPEPIEPVMRQFYVNCGTTGAGMRDLINEQAKKSYGVTLLADEISGWFRSQSQSYNVGLKEDFLSYYDGFGKRAALKGGLASDFDECLVSVLGGIQPNVFKEFNDGSDDSGSHARFNFVNQPTQPFIIPDDPQGNLDLLPLLSGFYEKISELPQLELRLSPDAKKQFHSLNNKCELYRVNAKSQALAALWGKMPGKIGRFAALIHVVECVASGQEIIDPIVGVGTLTKAATLAKFYYKEAENLYTSCESGNLTPTLANILLIAKESAPEAIKTRDVLRHKLFRTKEFKNLKSTDVQPLFVQLADMGYGSTQGAGVKIQFCHGLSQVVTSSCDKSNGIQDGDSSVLSQLSQEKNKIFKTQPTILDDSTILDEKAKNDKTAVTVVTKPENVYTEPIATCHNDLGQTVTSCDKTGDRIPDPIENKTTDFDALNVGDVLIAEFKELHIITARSSQQWLTHRGDYVSRTALQNQDFKQPTLGDMDTALGKIIVWQDRELAHLLIAKFRDDPRSLFCQTIATNKKLEEIYTL